MDGWRGTTLCLVACGIAACSGSGGAPDGTGNLPPSGVGNGWIEIETAGAAVVVDGARLMFADTSDAVMRPLVSHAFPEVSSGHLEWEFELDWAKIGDDDAYAVYMQLGHGAHMNASSPAAGVGVHLVWGRIGGLDQTLGYRRAGATTALTPITGARRSA